MTQNLRHGGGDRFEQLLNACLAYNPDVLVLTERRNNKQKLYESLNIGYHQYVIQDVSEKQNTVCVLTKKSSNLVSTYKNNVITLVNDGITIRGVYFPQKNDKKEVFDYISLTLADTSSLVIGDFNTGKHFIDEKGKTFYCDQEFAYLSEQKLSDARRTRHNDVSDYSRYSNAGNGFRIDHVLVTQDLDEQVKEVGYRHSVREEGLSDHSMMYVDLSMERPIS